MGSNVEELIRCESRRVVNFLSSESSTTLGSTLKSTGNSTPLPSFMYQPLNEAAENYLNHELYVLAEQITFSAICNGINTYYTEEIVDSAVDDSSIELFSKQYTEDILNSVIGNDVYSGESEVGSEEGEKYTLVVDWIQNLIENAMLVISEEDP